MTRQSVDRVGDDLLTSMHEIVALVTFLFIACMLGMGVKLGKGMDSPPLPCSSCGEPALGAA